MAAADPIVADHEPPDRSSGSTISSHRGSCSSAARSSSTAGCAVPTVDPHTSVDVPLPCAVPSRRTTKSTSPSAGTRARDDMVGADRPPRRVGPGRAARRASGRRDRGARPIGSSIRRPQIDDLLVLPVELALWRARDRQRRLQADAGAVGAVGRRRSGAASWKEAGLPDTPADQLVDHRVDAVVSDDGRGRGVPASRSRARLRSPTCRGSACGSRCPAVPRPALVRPRSARELSRSQRLGDARRVDRRAGSAAVPRARRSSACAPTPAGWSAPIRSPATCCASTCSSRLPLHMSATNYRAEDLFAAPTKPICGRATSWSCTSTSPTAAWAPRAAAPTCSRSIGLPPATSLLLPPDRDPQLSGSISGLASSIEGCVGAHFRRGRRQGGPAGAARPHARRRSSARPAQLADMLEHFADIDALDLDDVAPMAQPYPLAQRVPRGCDRPRSRSRRGACCGARQPRTGVFGCRRSSAWTSDGRAQSRSPPGSAAAR